MNLVMLLEMAASTYGDREALRSGDARYSFADLFRAAGGAARILRESGASRLALLDVSSPAVPIGLFASAWAGLPFAPLNYRLTGAELDALLERVDPALLVTDPERADALESRGAGRVVSREAFLSVLLERGPEIGTASDWPMEPEDVAIWLFTSGTTGAPKAALLRQRHLVSYILGSVEFASAGEDETALVSVPPYHIAGMAAILSSVYSGRRVVQLPNFDAEDWVALARAEDVTHAFVVPTMLARIVDALEAEGGAGLPRLRALAYGGGKMPQSVVERAMALLPDTAFTNAYGLTETSSTITLLGPDDHREALASSDPAVRGRLGSVGRALPGVEIEIRDEDGKAVGAGQRGEIHVRGEQVSGEYLGRGTQLTPDGFFPTRDGGWLDAEGFLFLDGRIDDVIVRGGENLSPGEIEDVLREHPSVADCAVVGVPDEQWGEAVGAAVVLAPGKGASPDELRDWVRDHLRSSRAPSVIEFRQSLPYNEMGKLLRRVIRDELGAAAQTAQ
jgi:acyl-CoA synthetase (AMP-forming)/AMP-acid ligase II